MVDATDPIGIVGAGAVGTILAAHFERAGVPTVLVERGPRHDEIARLGLRVTGLVDLRVTPRHLVRSLDALPMDDRLRPRVWFICTKAWSIPELRPALARMLPNDAWVVSVQNGMGAEKLLSESLGADRVACAVINFAGGHAPSGGVVRLVWFTPPNHVGFCAGSDRAAEALARALTRAGLRTEPVTTEGIRRQLFYKLVLSAGLNALCAVTGLTMQQAMSMPHTRSMARRLVQEGLQVGHTMGYGFGDDALDDAMAYLDRGGDHRPSMAVDLSRGTPTEIDYINGKLVELAATRSGVTVDTNRILASLVVTEEVKQGTRPISRIPSYLG